MPGLAAQNVKVGNVRLELRRNESIDRKTHQIDEKKLRRRKMSRARMTMKRLTESARQRISERWNNGGDSVFQSNLFVPKSLWNHTHRNFKVRPTSYGPSTLNCRWINQKTRPSGALRIRETSSRSQPFSRFFFVFELQFVVLALTITASRRNSRRDRARSDALQSF